MELKEMLKSLRKESGLTQKELSEKLQIGQTTIAAYENGIRDPQIYSLMAYADFFDCTIDYLVGRENDFGDVQLSNQTNDIVNLLQHFNKLSDKNKQLAILFVKLLKEKNQ